MTPIQFKGRMSFATERKQKLARKALSHIESGQLIIIDGGTTNLQLVTQLPIELNATVFTNCICIAGALLDYPNIELHFLGGRVLKGVRAAVGLDTIHALGEIQADLCVVGVRSVHEERGLSEIDKEEAQVKHQMIKQSRKVIALATNDKLNTVDHYRVCSRDEIDVLIVEDDEIAELVEAGL